MPKWIVQYEGGSEDSIEADSVSVVGTVIAFIKHSDIVRSDGKTEGTPIAFLNISNPNIQLVRMTEGKNAEVLSIV